LSGKSNKPNFYTMKKINLTQFVSDFLWLQDYAKCSEDRKNNLSEYMEQREKRQDEMMALLPHGSGIDSGIRFLADRSSAVKLVFSVPFHHMDEHGGYDGWTHYALIITPSFGGYNLKITGRDKQMTKEYLYDLFHDTFTV